jgi:hypothetical protein
VGQALATEAIADASAVAASGKQNRIKIALPRIHSGRGGAGCVIFWMCEVPHTLAWETGLAADMLAAMDGSVDRDVRDNR